MMTKPMSYAAFTYEYDTYTFQEYLDFIGVEKPDVKIIPHEDGGSKYRYSRLGAQGEWCRNRKAAKESYKLVLQAQREQAKSERHALVIESMLMNDCDLQILREAVGADVKRLWLERNFLLPDNDSPAHKAAIRLTKKGLMNDLGPHHRRTLYEVSPQGCRVAGVPETYINKYRFMG